MARNAVLRALIGAAFILYPLLVYFGLQSIEPRGIALILLLLGGLRLILGKGEKQSTYYWLVALAVAAGLTLITGSQYGLLVYPVLVNIVFFILFLTSLINPPSLIEKLARLREPELPAEAIEYTRKVTVVWCAFFLINGSIAGVTVFIRQDWWLLYNGLIAYLLMGTLFAGEYVVRKTWIRSS